MLNKIKSRFEPGKIIVILLMASLAIILSSCEKSPLIQPQTKQVFIEDSFEADSQSSTSLQLDGIKLPQRPGESLSSWDIDCRYANCRTMIEALKDQFQPIVDGSCKSMTFSIDCCDDNGNVVRRQVTLTPPPCCNSPFVCGEFPGS